MVLNNFIARLKTVNELLLFNQTIFSLPFAFLGVLLAGGGSPLQWILVSLALVAARTAGMSFNRVIDRFIDKENPRTCDRPLPSGRISPFAVWSLAIGSSALLVIVSFFLNWLCFVLSFAAIALLVAYSFFKRFSASSHLFLGFVEAAAPVGGFLAISGSFKLLPFVAGAAIMLWIAGFDILYALLDEKHDRTSGLHSIPARLGHDRAVIISVLLYVLALVALVYTGRLAYFTSSWSGAISAVAIIFWYQQRLIRKPGDLAVNVKKVFFWNRFVSPILLAGAILEFFL